MKFIGEVELSKDELTYPNPHNPRLKGLTVEEPSIKSLAASIKKDGQLQRIIVRKTGEKYEVIDGDRRCIAIFKVLGWNKIKASVYEMTDLEAMRLRLIANIQKEELSTIEKGKYCFELFKVLAYQEDLDPEKSWNNRIVRSKILSSIANELDVSIQTIINWIRLWQRLPYEFQHLVASNKEELRKGLLAPSTVEHIYRLSYLSGVPFENLIKHVIEHNWRHDALTRLITKVKESFQRFNLEELNDLYKEFIENRACRSFFYDRRLLIRLKQYADKMGMKTEELLNLALHFALNSDNFHDYVVKHIERRSH